LAQTQKGRPAGRPFLKVFHYICCFALAPLDKRR